jgi:hypothetical protein
MEEVITQIVVVNKGEAIYHESATTVSIDDEAAGEFVILSQENEHAVNKIKIDVDEWPHIRKAINKMIKRCRQ